MSFGATIFILSIKNTQYVQFLNGKKRKWLPTIQFREVNSSGDQMVAVFSFPDFGTPL
jgi:hypothetical protein